MKVQGNNVVVYIDVDGEWIPYACALNATISYTTEMIETSVSGSGVWANFLPTKNSWTANIDGFVSIDEEGSLTLGDLRAKQFNQEQILLKYQRTDDAGNTYTEQGYAYITASSDTGSFGGMNTFTVDFQGTGEIAQTFDPAVIAARYKTGLTPILCCANFLGVTLYSSDELGIGTQFFSDSGLSIPYTGKNYISDIEGTEVFHINNATGVVDSTTGAGCFES